MQMDGPATIENGWSAMRNLLGLFFLYGMPLRWTQRVREKKCLRHL